MNPDTLKYLQQDQIGKVIAKGLAHLYTNKPERPIKNLAEWLKTYSKNQKQLTAVVKAQQNKAMSLKILDQNRKLEETKKAAQDKKVSDRQKTIDNFKNELLAHDYQQQMLEETFPQFVEKQTSITGAYVGYLNHPPREVTDEDTDEQAHLNTAAEKCINYIGSSESHKKLMRGKMLSLNEGVTGKAFSLAEQQPPVVNQDGQEVPQPAKQSYIYVPNVVKNETMHYFRIPKLGAYLAVPLIYNLYLTQKNFDAGLQAKQKYLAELDEFNQKKQEELDELNPQKEELEKKIGEIKQKNAEDPNLQPLQTELKELNEKIAAKSAESIEQPVTQLPIQKQNYVFCVDNLGKDKQLQKEDIKLIVELVEQFKNTIEKKEKDLLFKDVERHVNMIKQLGKQPDAIKQELQKGIQIDEESAKQLNEIEDQNLKAYKTEQWQFNKLKSCIKSNQIYLKNFIDLKKYRVVKYRDLIQSILFFLGKSKGEINIPGRASLNWKQVKCKQIDKETFNKVLDYLVQGAKTQNFNFYGKTPFLTDVFEKFDQSEIFGYNVGLGALLKFIKAALKHRNSNVELRRAQKEAQRKKRQDIIVENEKIETQKAAQLQKHKAALAPEDVEGFNEQEWLQKYSEEHKLTQVPAEVVDDVDNDM